MIRPSFLPSGMEKGSIPPGSAGWTVSTLSIELRNDGDRYFLPVTDPELNVVYQIAFLRGNREKVRIFLSWAKSAISPQ